MRSGTGNSFTQISVQRVRRAYHLKSRFNRLRALGLLTVREMAETLRVTASAVKYWKVRGLYRAYRFNHKGECLYAPPPANLPGKGAHKQAYLKQLERSLLITSEEVQYEAQALSGGLLDRPSWARSD
jgi:hypothetical protein